MSAEQRPQVDQLTGGVEPSEDTVSLKPMDPISRQALIGGPCCARDLVGQYVVREHIAPDDQSTGCIWRITEAEYYGGHSDWPDPASYAQRGLTKGKPMYGPPGLAYLVTIRGQYGGFNVTAEEEGQPGAILITGIELVGTTKCDYALWRSAAGTVVRGPHRVREVLALSSSAMQGHDLTQVSELFLADAKSAGHRLSQVGEGLRRGIVESKNRPWRFYSVRDRTKLV